MDSRLVVSFFVSISLLAYLTINILPYTAILYDSQNNFTMHTKVYLKGNPSNLAYYGNEVRFKIQDAEIRVKGLVNLEGNITVIGTLEEYRGRKWIQAIMIKNG